MSQYGGIRILYRSDEALSGLYLIHLQTGMDGGDDHIQLAEELVWIIKSAICQDIRLDAGKEPEVGLRPIELHDFIQLSQQSIYAETIGIDGGLEWSVMTKYS